MVLEQLEDDDILLVDYILLYPAVPCSPMVVDYVVLQSTKKQANDYLNEILKVFMKSKIYLKKCIYVNGCCLINKINIQNYILQVL